MRDLEFGWFIPTRGDTDDYGEPLKIAAGPEMFERVVVAAENAGFEYILIPVGHQCWDAWMTGALMAGKTKSIRMLIAARPSYINPVLLAKMIATFDQLSKGRICVNLIAGQSEQENIAEAQKNRALVVLAEAEVPKAMADAFRSGNMGIMDYYRMKNIQSDTAMRGSIAGEGGAAGATTTT